MAVRDSFSQATKTNLAKRAAYLCSCPDCRAFTLGARADGDGVINIGVAAHITAASAGGPRFDPLIDAADRASEQNGLWLCANCHTRIDANPEHFTIAMLREWKLEAEARSFEHLGRRPQDLDQAVHFQPEIVAYDYLFLKAQLEAKGPSIEETVDAWRQAALRDVADFKALRGWPISPINLSVRSSRSEDDAAIPNFAAALELATDVVIASPPGTGKSTTMIQLASAILDAGRRVAICVPLSQWGAQGADLLPSLKARGPFSHLDIGTLRLLAAEGRLVLMLDGWNELDLLQRRRLRLQLQQLRREYPLLVLVVATRARTDLPVEGQQFQIEAMSEDEQQEVARRMRGEDGIAVLDAAWRVPGLRDLVAIPLFLTALLERAEGAALPRSKDEILEGYVRAQARDNAREDSLQAELEDMAFRYLEALARAMQESQLVLFDVDQARQIISRTAVALIAKGQIGAAPKPGRAIDILADLHLLVRLGDGGAVQFQHQQIQEWFASRDVESAIRSAAAGDMTELAWLRSTVLNWRHWDETLLFAVERISASGSSDTFQLLAVLLNETFRLDPDLAAEVVARAPETFWSAVGPAIVDFATEWHEVGVVDRAVDFMITTGKPEFADIVWPLITDPNTQVHLRAMRAGNSFRPSVLGPDVAMRIAGAPAEVRAHILFELASNSGMEGIELATNLAVHDPDPEVRYQTFSALEFRSASRHAVRLLEASPPETWDLVAARDYWQGIGNAAVIERLRALREQQRAGLTDRIAILQALLDDPEGRDADNLSAILADPQFPVSTERVYHLLDRLAARWPQDVAAAMVKRLEDRLPLPFRAESLLTALPARDDGLLIERVLNDPAGDDDAEAAARLAGPKTVAILIEQTLARRSELEQVSREQKEEVREAYWAALARAAAAPFASLVDALAGFENEEDPQHIHDFAEIINRHRGGLEERAMALTETQSLQMVSLITQWAKALLGNPAATRTQVASLAIAIERVPREELLDTLEALLAEDLERYRQQWEQFQARPSRHDQAGDMHMGYGLQFSRAFVAIGGERTTTILARYLESERFGGDAAMALRRIFARRTGEGENRSNRRWPDFSQLAAPIVAGGSLRPEPGPEAAALFNAITNLSGEQASVRNREQALYLLKVMVGMPHANHPSIPTLLADMDISPLAKRDAMAALAMTGGTLPANAISHGLAAFLERAEKERWLLDADHSDLGRWLALFPYSDRSADLFATLETLDPRLLHQRNLDELYEALRWAPTGVGDVGLVELARRFPKFARDHAWRNALLDRPERTAFEAFCEALEAGAILHDRDTHSFWSLGDKIAGKISADPHLRPAFLERYRASEDIARKVYDHALSNMRDPDNIVAMVECYAGWAREFDGVLAEALRNCALSYRPSTRTTSSQEIIPNDLTSLRLRLVAILREGSDKAGLAKRCLEHIEVIRRDYGEIETEPRHPDIESDVLWPPIAASLPDVVAIVQGAYKDGLSQLR